MKVWEAAQHQVSTTNTHGKEPNQPVLELPKESPPAMTRRRRTSPPLCCHITSFLESFLPFVTLLFPPSLPPPPPPRQTFSTHPLPPSVSPLSPAPLLISPYFSLFFRSLPLFSVWQYSQSLLFLSPGHSSIFLSLKCLAVALRIPSFSH